MVSRSFGISPIKPSSRVQWLAVAVFALVAAALLYRTFANPVYSSNPNDVVLEYVQPHNDIERVDRLSDAHYTPFVLYGNGLLVCGQNDEHQFEAPNLPVEGEAHEHTSQPPTARTLAKAEMSQLIQSVRDSGFEQLDAEYFELPVAQQEYTIRLVLKKGEKTVQYYNDVTPPTAYLQTLNIMKDACAKTVQPLTSDTVTIRTRVDVDTAGKEVEPIDGFEEAAAVPLKNVMNKGKAAKRQNDAKRAVDQQVEESDEQMIEISGAAAKALLQTRNGKSSKFVSFEGANYEVAVEPELPKVNNPMNIDYNKVRAETEKKKANKNKSMTSRVFDALDPSQTASAATNGGFRVVLLLPSNGGSTGKLDEAKSMYSKTYSWACKRVGRCPIVKGVTVVRGSQTQAYYNACHETRCYGNQLLNILNNVYRKDPNTISRSDVATIVVPGWKTNTLSTSGSKACGWGYKPGNLSAVDLYQTSKVNGLSCIPLAKAFPHEYFHNRGLGHNTSCTNRYLMDGPPGCRYSNDCNISGTTRPICILATSQSNYLKSLSTY